MRWWNGQSRRAVFARGVIAAAAGAGVSTLLLGYAHRVGLGMNTVPLALAAAILVTFLIGSGLGTARGRYARLALLAFIVFGYAALLLGR